MSSPLPQRSLRVPRLAGAAVERARLTVVPRLARRTSRVPFVTLVSLLLLGGVIGLLMFNTTMQQNSFRATALEGRSSDLTAREQQLQMELEALRNPQVVAEKAQKLGMVPAVDPAVVDLSRGRVLGTPVAAGPDNRLDVRPPRAAKPARPAPRKVIVPAEEGADRRDARAERRSRERGANGGNGGANADNPADTDRTSDTAAPRNGRNG